MTESQSVIQVYLFCKSLVQYRFSNVYTIFPIKLPYFFGHNALTVTSSKSYEVWTQTVIWIKYKLNSAALVDYDQLLLNRRRSCQVEVRMFYS